MKRLVGYSSLVIAFSYLCCCSAIFGITPNDAAAEGEASKTIEKYFYVKGMTCAGCVFGVKAALKRAGVPKNNIKKVTYKEPDPENQIGHALVEFAPDEYKGLESDCKIIKEIKSNPGYLAYLDPRDTNPCKL